MTTALAQAPDPAATDATPVQRCVGDLQALKPYLLANDTGAPEQWARKGAAHFEKALADAQAEAASITSIGACKPILRNYLKAWRNGHIGVAELAPLKTDATAKVDAQPTPTKNPAPSEPQPRVRALSSQTLLITLPSFAWDHAKPIQTLLKQHRAQLIAHPRWILDVRGNGGGSDSTYAPLLPWLLPDETATNGISWLATPDNVKAHEAVCAAMGNDPECLKFMAPVIQQIKAAKPGSYVVNDGKAMAYDREKKPEQRRPGKVVVLMDKGCGSSCEQFLLAVRQGFGVKLIGQPSAGVLDFSNMRPHTLPSGHFQLWYATSRSTRMPQLVLDDVGVQPDIYLPASDYPVNPSTKEDVLLQRVQRWLEGGSLKP